MISRTIIIIFSIFTWKRWASPNNNNDIIINNNHQLIFSNFHLEEGLIIYMIIMIDDHHIKIITLTWKRQASPKAVERQNMKSRLGCSGMGCRIAPSERKSFISSLFYVYNNGYLKFDIPQIFFGKFDVRLAPILS